jgi:hypothetical protein
MFRLRRGATGKDLPTQLGQSPERTFTKKVEISPITLPVRLVLLVFILPARIATVVTIPVMHALPLALLGLRVFVVPVRTATAAAVNTTPATYVCVRTPVTVACPVTTMLPGRTSGQHGMPSACFFGATF